LNALNPFYDNFYDTWRIYGRKNFSIGTILLNITVDFEVDIDAIACMVGDVVLVQSLIPDWGRGGRIRSATANTLP
jgi:hypothetical protein